MKGISRWTRTTKFYSTNWSKSVAESGPPSPKRRLSSLPPWPRFLKVSTWGTAKERRKELSKRTTRLLSDCLTSRATSPRKRWTANTKITGDFASKSRNFHLSKKILRIRATLRDWAETLLRKTSLRSFLKRRTRMTKLLPMKQSNLKLELLENRRRRQRRKLHNNLRQ